MVQKINLDILLSLCVGQIWKRVWNFAELLQYARRRPDRTFTCYRVYVGVHKREEWGASQYIDVGVGFPWTRLFHICCHLTNVAPNHICLRSHIAYSLEFPLRHIISEAGVWRGGSVTFWKSLSVSKLACRQWGIQRNISFVIASNTEYLKLSILYYFLCATENRECYVWGSYGCDHEEAGVSIGHGWCLSFLYLISSW